jgi:hypothetical protein
MSNSFNKQLKPLIMMKKIILITFIQLLIAGFCLQAQKITFKSGSLDFIKGQQVILVKYDYSNIGVGKFDKEDDYITQKVADYNKKEAGTGDKWKEGWFNDRQTRYAPKFEELFNKGMESKNLKCSQNASEAKYEMIVHTTFIEPGFNVGVTRKPAFVSAEIIFKEIGTGKELAVVIIQNSPGNGAMGYDFDAGLRIQEGYAKMGKSLAAFIIKKNK